MKEFKQSSDAVEATYMYDRRETLQNGLMPCDLPSISYHDPNLISLADSFRSLYNAISIDKSSKYLLVGLDYLCNDIISEAKPVPHK